MAINTYTYIFLSKALQSIAILGFLVRKSGNPETEKNFGYLFYTVTATKRHDCRLLGPFIAAQVIEIAKGRSPVSPSIG
jgi:hypothetical protein